MHTTIGSKSGVRGRSSCKLQTQTSARLVLKYRLSHLNLIRSVTTILETMNRAMKEQQDRLQRQQRSLSPSRSFRSATSATVPSSEVNGPSDEGPRDTTYDFSDKHKLLQLRLQPLAPVRGDLERYLGTATKEPDQVSTAGNIAFPDLEDRPQRRHMEFSVQTNSSWRVRLLGKEDSPRPAEKKYTQDLHDAIEILHRCGPDIKQLWTDDVVQQVLAETKTQIKHSSGL